ncbi:MAG: hypothetical protein DHS20C05_19390 [Hyphococcus sp.]|nr:MAG: hypothetical protein DHS20C05_19390 [Marinicaulis sp.]
MKRLIMIATAFAVVGCLPVQTKKQIIVDGEATIEVEPDIFVISGNVRAREEDQASALKAISEKLSNVQNKLPNLVGLEALSIEATDAEISPVQDQECLEKRRYNTEEVCPVTGYFGSISLKVKGTPATASGSAFSFLSELGAENVSLSEYAFSNLKRVREEAIQAAMKDARTKAKGIATATGAELSGPVRIQYGEGFSDQQYNYYEERSQDSVVVAAGMARPDADMTPAITIDLDPQPIKITEKIVASFEIE